METCLEITNGKLAQRNKQKTYLEKTNEKLVQKKTNGKLSLKNTWKTCLGKTN